MPLLSTFGAASARSFGGIGAAAAGAGLDIDEVFSTFLYDGTGSSQAINNGIDLSNEGGLVWIKSRTTSDTHLLFDTIRGTGKYLISHDTSQEATNNQLLTAFNSNGFSLGTDNGANQSTQDYVAWSFRKSKGFFDVVKITGDGTSGRNISHNLGQKPGMIIGTRYDANFEHWHVYHRSLDGGNQPATHALRLNSTNAEGDESSYWNDTEPTSTQFTVGNNLNHSGGSFIFYLFAHNNSDGGFGPDSDQDVIKCGSYTGGTTGTEVNVGFEPQLVMIKRASGSGDWMMFDAMRGVVNSAYPNLDNTLFWNLSNAERTNTGYIGFTPTGFEHQGGSGDTNTNGETYIYMAIRRGPLAEPTSATDVFAMDSNGLSANSEGVYFTSNFPVDFTINKERTHTSDPWVAMSRLQGNGNYLDTSSTAAEVSGISNGTFDHMTGWMQSGSAMMSWMWKRAPSFCDVVAYTGTGSARTVSHNLGVVPEMMWVKRRSGTRSWFVYHSALGNTGRIKLDTTDAGATGFGDWNSTTPTSSVFSVGSNTNTNGNGETYIAYLFATVAGVSKVGSYTGNGSSQNIDCGFSSGARFVLIKNADATGSWILFDTLRGIVAGNDSYLKLDSTSAEGGGYDFIDPHSSGFTVNQTGGVVLSESGQTYIFYAIA